MLTELRPSRVIAWTLAVLTLLFGVVFPLAGCGRSSIGDEYTTGATDSGTDGDAPDAPALTTIEVLPGATTLPVGASQGFKARGLYADGSTADVSAKVTWGSDAPSIVVVDATGKATAKAAGTAHVVASSGTLKGQAIVTVPKAALVAIRVTPPSAKTTVGGSISFTATASYADGSAGDVSGSAAWSVDDPSIANMVGGFATGFSAGSTTVRASIGAISGSATLEVSSKKIVRIEINPPSPTIAVGVVESFSALAIYADGTTSDVTTSASWSSDDLAVANVASTGPSAGRATGVGAGITPISASYGGLSATTTLTVSGVPLVSITITPPGATLPLGGLASFAAIASFADGSSADITSTAVWSSLDSTVVIVSGGVASATGPGSTSITASFGGLTGSALVNVTTASVVSIAITPASPIVPLGSTVSLKATATLSDGSSIDVTTSVFWSTDDATIASVSNVAGTNGRASSSAPGTTIVHARLGGIEGTTRLTVPAGALVSITLSPDPMTLKKGATSPATAKASYSDGSSGDVTATCFWSSSDATVASVSNGATTRGQVTGVSAGGATISCTVAGITGSLSVTVTGGATTLVSIAIVPSSTIAPIGTTQPLKAIGTFSDGSTSDVTTTASWSSDSPGVASVDASGRVTGTSPGTARITATQGGTSGSATVLVPTVSITSIRVDPPTASTTVGGTSKFTATATFSDGTTADVTAFATWTSDPTVASVAAGVATGVGAGTTKIVATLASVSGVAVLTVSGGKVLSSVQVTPFSPSTGVGGVVSFRATALYTDGTTADVTASSTWTSSAPAVASVASGTPSAGQATGVSAGSAVITASFGGLSGSSPISITSAALASVSVSPSSATISKGGTALLKATATYADGTTTDVTATAAWSSSDASVASVSAGAVKGVAAGSATITASFGGFSGSASITVSAARLLSITISPADPTVPISGTRAFTATGSYDDGSTLDLTTSVTWSIDDPSIATISNSAGSNGLATGVSVGTSKVHATLGAVGGSTSITVSAPTLSSIAITPNPMSMVASDKQLATATATYSDGSTADVSTTCVWASFDVSVASVSNSSGSQGLVTAVGAGSTTISCSQGGVTGSAKISVSTATLSSISVSPIAATCRIGDTLQFNAQAIDTSGKSTNVTFAAKWSSSDTAIVAPSGFAPGRFKCVAKGTVTITAAYGGLTGSTTATVSDAVLVSIQVDPAATTIASGWTQPFTATAIFSDGTSQPVTGASTWVSSSPSVAGVSDTPGSKGRATGLSAGSTTISATYKGVTGSTTLTVSSAVVTSISVNPASRTAPVGTRFGYTAQAIYSDGTSKDITGLATWLSSDSSVAQVSDAPGTKGAAVAISVGSVTVTARWSGLTGTASLTVSGATLTSVQLTPFTASVAVGVPVFYRADAVYSDGSTVNVTGMATWVSSDPSVAAVSDAAGTKGRATPIAPGTATIRATFGGLTGTATLTVTSAKLVEIQVTPFTPELPVGYGIFLAATAVYDDGSTVDVTGLASWVSEGPTIASVSNGGGTKGLVTPNAPGSATIKATFGGVTGSDVVKVTSATLVSIAIDPSPADVTIGGSTPLTATGTFSDGSTLDITFYVGWLSSDRSIADVSNAGFDKGTAYGFKSGSVTVSAVKGGVTGKVTLTSHP